MLIQVTQSQIVSCNLANIIDHMLKVIYTSFISVWYISVLYSNGFTTIPFRLLCPNFHLKILYSFNLQFHSLALGHITIHLIVSPNTASYWLLTFDHLTKDISSILFTNTAHYVTGNSVFHTPNHLLSQCIKRIFIIHLDVLRRFTYRWNIIISDQQRTETLQAIALYL